MLCDNILPNLNISKLVTDRLYNDVKITYDTKMIHIMVSLGCLQRQKLETSWYFTNFCSDKHVFSSYAKSSFFRLIMWKIATLLQVTRWNIENPALKKDMIHPFLWEWT